MKQVKSECIYCKLSLFGKGCRFGPSGLHVHSVLNRCIYCGLNQIGRGCRFAPNGIHVQFSEFGFLQKESIQSGFITGYMLKRLSQPFTSFDAYKLGIINDQGEQIKQPITDQELSAYNIFESTLISLKKSFSKQISFVVNETQFVKTLENSKVFNSKAYEKELEFKEAVATIATNLYNTIEQYKEDLSVNQIDQYIMEGFLNAKIDNT